MRVRPAGPDDIATLLALDPIAARSVDRARSIAQWVGAGWCSAAEIDGALAGYAVVHPHFFGRNFLEMLMVAPAFRRRGIGRALLVHALDAQPGAILWTSTNLSNAPMRNLLAQFGFTRMGVIEGLDEGDPELIFRSGV
ncbi:GNAT family N-acetyltransferase [Devosia sp. SD17-2]|uniref:GNAT family N-acetyltransferase n=1 Tax=Devosia sp. SD17-2 TaxID=2976459 RepID=UPI0023D89D48|nr:GNAT family N-acetyltransferase [Devosia sp. SD17-2]WEJ32819.1 GNAT family N-acetyltransferase [Devosia sp. SD17-2]